MVDNLPPDIRHNLAAGADNGPAGRVNGENGGGFGQAVTFADIDMEFLDKILLYLQGQNRAAADDQPQGFHILRRCQFGEQTADGRHDIHIGDLFLPNDGDGFLGRKGVQDNNACAAVQGVEHRAGPAKSVIHGQDAEYMTAGIAIHALFFQLLAVGDEIGMGEHGPFGIAGGAGGVDDGTGLVLVKISRQQRCCGGFFVQLAAGLDVQLHDL